MDYGRWLHHRHTWLSSRVFDVLIVSLLLLTSVLCVREALGGAWPTALAWFACMAVEVGVLAFRRSLPSFFGLMLTLAALVNAAGYVLNLWHDRTLFDELVHAFTSFAGMAAAGWLFLPANGRPSTAFFFWFALAGLAAGVAWEGFEWIIGIIGDMRDTLIDLLMDSLGIGAAGVLLYGLTRSSRSLR